MVPNGSAYANYPSFANNGAKTPPGGSPESAKYALGMVPADTFPAEWANWLFHGATAGITRLNTDVGSIKKEINSVLAAYNVTPDATAFNQLYTAIEKRLTALTQSIEAQINALDQEVDALTPAFENRIRSLYPVGTIYQNKTDSRSPATLLGFGTWVRITDKFLASIGSVYGASGGRNSYPLTEANIPQHTHGLISGATGYNSANVEVQANNTGITAEFPHRHLYNKALLNGIGETGTTQNFFAYMNEAGQDYTTGPYSSSTSDPNAAVTVHDPTHSHGITDHTHNHVITALSLSSYGAASPTAIDTVPEYIGVYTWYRES